MTDSTLRAIIQGDDYLKLAPFTSTEETRFYLQGIFIEPAREGSARITEPQLTATDGHALATVRARTEEGYILSSDDGFILRATPDVRRLLASACKGARAAYLACYADRVDVLHGPLEMNKPDTSIKPELSLPAHAAYIDGTFPEWRKVLRDVGAPSVVDSGPSKAQIGYNPDYLARFKGFGKSVCVLPQGENPAFVTTPGDPRLLGVVMPMRAHDSTFDWTAHIARVVRGELTNGDDKRARQTDGFKPEHLAA